MNLYTVRLGALILGSFFVVSSYVHAATPPTGGETPNPSAVITSQINEKQDEIDAINKKIADLSAKKSQTANEAQAIAITLEQLKANLQRAQLQLSKTQVTIASVQQQQQSTSEQVSTLQENIQEKKQELDSLLRQLYEFEQVSLIQVLFDSQSLSDVLSQRNAYKALQQKAVGVLTDMHTQEADLHDQQDKLDQQQTDLGQLKAMLNSQTQDLAQKKSDQKKFLQQKQSQQAQYEGLIAEAQQARDEIKRQIFTLQSGGGVQVSLQTATDMAKYAAKVTGVRASLIMAVLKVESDVGNNIGSGVFPDDMRPDNRDAFLRICAQLGLDPHKAQISRRQSYGWGGAMGPAQIIPNTWESMAARVAQLMGKKVANPYELSDAFVATGIFLADRGAQSPAGEYEAVNRYLAGPHWQYYTWYGDKVLAVAKEYASQGL